MGLRHHRGKTVRYPEKLSLAIDDATEAIRIDPGFADAYCNRGEAYYHRASQTRPTPLASKEEKKASRDAQQSDYQKALDDLSTAIRLDPNNARAYSERCNAYMSRYYTAVYSKGEIAIDEGDKARWAADLEAMKRVSKKP